MAVREMERLPDLSANLRISSCSVITVELYNEKAAAIRFAAVRQNKKR
jgi:hypothetical protein